jgi:uncharacterized membrane-anchored protein YhcB (DUF1043 family)
MALWCAGIVAVVAGLVMGGIVLHRALTGQSQHEVRHSLRHVCNENPVYC